MDRDRTLSVTEAERLAVIQAVAERRLSAPYAAAALAARRWGRAPGCQLPQATKVAVVARLR